MPRLVCGLSTGGLPTLTQGAYTELMRKAKKSIHVEVVALSLFIGVLAVYAVFSTFGSNAQAGPDANGQCSAKFDECVQQKMKEDPNKTEQQAKDECIGPTMAQMCSDSMCQGKCAPPMGGGKYPIVCGGEKCGNQPEKASDEGAKKAKEAADKAAKDLADKAKKEEPKGGGEPKMPEMPKKEPKPPEQKDPNACSNGKPRGVDGKCPDENPPASFESFWEKAKSSLPESLQKAFGLQEPDKLSPVDQLQQIAGFVNRDASVPTSQKEALTGALNDYITAARANGNTQPIESLVAINKNRPIDDIESATTDLNDYAASAGGTNELNPVYTGSSNPQASENIITAVGNWLKGLFGF